MAKKKDVETAEVPAPAAIAARPGFMFAEIVLEHGDDSLEIVSVELPQRADGTPAYPGDFRRASDCFHHKRDDDQGRWVYRR